MHLKYNLTNKVKYLSIILPITILIFSYFGALTNLFNNIGMNYIHNASKAYLEASEVASSKTFLLLSVAKTGLSIIESGKIGISLIIDTQIQIGGLFVSLKEIVDYSWISSFSALSLIFITKIILVYSHAINIFLFSFTSLLWLISNLAQAASFKYRHFIERGFYTVFLITILISLCLPISIYITSIASTQLTNEYKNNIDNSLSEHNKLYIKYNESIKKSAHEAVDILKNQGKDVQNHVSKLHSHLYIHIATLVIEIILLPLLLFFLMYSFLRSITKTHHVKVISNIDSSANQQHR